jgi:MSHA biogenesis protein MshJ
MIKIKDIPAWFSQRSPRDQLYLFLLGLVIIYLTFSRIFLHPLTQKITTLTEQMSTLKDQKTATEQQINTLQQAIQNPLLLQMINEEKRLNANLAIIQQQLKQFKPRLTTSTRMAQLTNDILKQQGGRIAIRSIIEMPVEPLLQADIDKTNPAELVTADIYSHGLQIEFQSDFFSAIDYLKRLERLPWALYWDNLEYKVINYPLADIVIKLHILSIQKS